MDHQTERVGMIHGSWVRQSQMQIGVEDTGFRQAVTAVERLRTYGGRIFSLEAHLRRWDWSTSKLAISGLPDADQIKLDLSELLVRNAALLESEKDVGITMFATPGNAGDDTPTFGLHLNPLQHGKIAKHRQDGQPLVISDVQQPATTSWPRSIKSRSRIHYYLADQFANDHCPGSLGILLDQDGTITETSNSNMATVIDGAIQSPPSERVLSGVTQLMVEILAEEIGIPWAKAPVTIEQLFRADEVLMMGTDGGIWFANSISNQPVSGGTAGPVYQRLLAAFDEMTGCGAGSSDGP